MSSEVSSTAQPWVCLAQVKHSPAPGRLIDVVFRTDLPNTGRREEATECTVYADSIGRASAAGTWVVAPLSEIFGQCAGYPRLKVMHIETTGAGHMKSVLRAVARNAGRFPEGMEFVLPTIVFSGSDLDLVEFPFIRRLTFCTAARRGTVFSCPSCEIVNVPECGLVFAEGTNPRRARD